LAERRRMEEALRRVNAELTEANQKLQELDKMKDQFVSNVSHELRTPHANIKLYLRLLEHGKPEKYVEYMQTLHREVARQEKMIDYLLDISRLERCVTPIEAIPTDLNQLLDQLLIDRTILAAQRGLTLDYQPAHDLPKALADPAGLTQVFSNLVTNAVNYTPSGGVVTVTTASRQHDGSDWVTFTVKDTGQGISTKELPHLFQRFYRGEVGRKATAPGTGLGLAICKDLINRLGGQITVDSEPGHGAAFTVWLKRAA
jgi:signal transduction histidine kinase